MQIASFQIRPCKKQCLFLYIIHLYIYIYIYILTFYKFVLFKIKNKISFFKTTCSPVMFLPDDNDYDHNAENHQL